MIFQNIFEIWDGQHVELIQVHEVTKCSDGVVIGKEHSVFRDSGEGLRATQAGILHCVGGLPCARSRFIIVPGKHQVEKGECVDGNDPEHAKLGLEADTRIEVVDSGDVESHHAHAGTFFGAFGLFKVELRRITPGLACEGVGDAVDVMRTLNVKKGHGFTGQDGQLRWGEIVIGHHDGMVRFALSSAVKTEEKQTEDTRKKFRLG